MGSYEQIQGRILGPGAGSWRPAPHALVRVAGPDAADYLHRLCSQDVVGMVPGDVRPACFLDGKGRLLQIVMLARVEDGLWVEAQDHKAKELFEFLELYHFAEDLRLSRPPEGWECVEVWSMTPPEEPVPGKHLVLGDGGIALSWQRGDLTWVRYHGPGADPSVRELSENERECLSILAGMPRVGLDTDGRMLALEAPLEDHISTTKGCYTGQEIVARIHTYGHTNRALCRLGIEGTGDVEAGTSLLELEESEEVGRVMRVVEVPGDAVPGEPGRLGFGFLPSAFTKAGTELVLGEAGGPAVTVLGP